MASDYFTSAEANMTSESFDSEPTLFNDNFDENLDENWDDAPIAEWDVPVLGVSSILSEGSAQYGDRQNFNDVWEPFTSAPEAVQEIMRRVLKIEMRRLNTRKTYGVKNDILKVIYTVIPE
jgi:hypothetical protein